MVRGRHSNGQHGRGCEQEPPDYKPSPLNPLLHPNTQPCCNLASPKLLSHSFSATLKLLCHFSVQPYPNNMAWCCSAIPKQQHLMQFSHTQTTWPDAVQPYPNNMAWCSLATSKWPGYVVVCLTLTTLPLTLYLQFMIWFCDHRWTWWKAKLEIQDAQRQPIMVVNGPCCPCSCGSDVEFPVSRVLLILQPSVIR